MRFNYFLLLIDIVNILKLDKNLSNKINLNTQVKKFYRKNLYKRLAGRCKWVFALPFKKPMPLRVRPCLCACAHASARAPMPLRMPLHMPSCLYACAHASTLDTRQCPYECPFLLYDFPFCFALSELFVWKKISGAFSSKIISLIEIRGNLKF